MLIIVFGGGCGGWWLTLPARRSDRHCLVIEIGEHTVPTIIEIGEHTAPTIIEIGEHTLPTIIEIGEHTVPTITEIGEHTVPTEYTVYLWRGIF